MRTEQLFLSLAALALSFALILIGFFLFLAPYVPTFAATARVVVNHHLEILGHVGLGLLFLGLLFLLLLMFSSRRRYLLLQMGGISVKDRLIAHFAKECLQKIFPEKLVECDVIVKRKKKLAIVANVPFVAEDEQEKILHTIESELALVLKQQFQYEREFILNLQFASH